MKPVQACCFRFLCCFHCCFLYCRYFRSYCLRFRAFRRKGYITRRSVEQDARLKQLVLTEKGRQFHEDTMRAFHQTDEYVAGLLTEEENTELLRLLNKLYLGLK